MFIFASPLGKFQIRSKGVTDSDRLLPLRESIQGHKGDIMEGKCRYLSTLYNEGGKSWLGYMYNGKNNQKCINESSTW